MKINDVLNYFPESNNIVRDQHIVYSDATHRILKTVHEALKKHRLDCEVSKSSLLSARFEYLFWKDARTQKTDRNQHSIPGTQNDSAKTVCLKVLEALEHHSKEEIDQMIDALPTHRGAPKGAAKSVLDTVLPEDAKLPSKICSRETLEQIEHNLLERIASSPQDDAYQEIYDMLFKNQVDDVGIHMEELFSLQYIRPTNAEDLQFIQQFNALYPDSQLSEKSDNRFHNGNYKCKESNAQAMREIIFFILKRRYQHD